MKIRRRRTRNQERTMLAPRKATTSVSDTSMITMMKMTMPMMITMLSMMTIGDEDDRNEDDFENVTSIGASQAALIFHFPSLRSRFHQPWSP